MEKLDKLVLFKIALDFDLPDIVNFCLTFKKINEKICLNQRFWLEKIYKDYNIKTGDIPSKYKLKDGLDYKKYYQYINFMMNKYKNNYDNLLKISSEVGELNLVKLLWVNYRNGIMMGVLLIKHLLNHQKFFFTLLNCIQILL